MTQQEQPLLNSIDIILFTSLPLLRVNFILYWFFRVVSREKYPSPNCQTDESACLGIPWECMAIATVDDSQGLRKDASKFPRGCLPRMGEADIPGCHIVLVVSFLPSWISWRLMTLPLEGLVWWLGSLFYSLSCWKDVATYMETLSYIQVVFLRFLDNLAHLKEFQDCLQLSPSPNGMTHECVFQQGKILLNPVLVHSGFLVFIITTPSWDILIRPYELVYFAIEENKNLVEVKGL